ncbi:DNA polymerase III subunit gamma and tau [Curtobacterium sp. MCLR17_036]|uniref:DNA polymerase III subunit gamma and tau n=1 Tax=Curtobacterium sp. MCLR17_036 TaxID=2175620 RepID=UPI000DA799B7|nr:DNA polymerase III subunit gamma and tau [Curtobacterium sp. MCLR17_036]WIE63911.1 DNA polymerase III subunit gamma and tau [Curtobacterium sp. MCLR17_036]
MVTALYRRYRPENFAELIGQSQVTDPLRTALRTNRVNHAYLFSGPRGCGKTTSARILARCLNCAEGPTDTPCGVCPSCVELARDGSGSLDVIEIDAASHNGVDDARDLRDRAVFAPARDRYKIFILDEAHMVTPQGFNALLKLVEEPPEHVKFIFATTEPEKVIGTIRSRTHHYPFRLVPPAAMLEYVEQLCTQESVGVAPGVLPLVVRAGGGSVRDTLSLLDQLMAGSEDGAIAYERAVALLGYTDAALLDDVVDALAVADPASAFAAIDRVVQTGQDPRRFVEDLLERLRDLIVVAATNESAAAVLRGVSPEELDTMTRQAGVFGATGLSRGADIANRALTEMTGATSPRLHLELMTARMLVPEADDTQRGALARVERLERRVGVGDAGGHQATSSVAAAPVVAQPDAPAAPRREQPAAAAPAPTRTAAPAAPAPTAAPAAASGAPAAPQADAGAVARDAAASWAAVAPSTPEAPAASDGPSQSTGARTASIPAQAPTEAPAAQTGSTSATPASPVSPSSTGQGTTIGDEPAVRPVGAVGFQQMRDAWPQIVEHVQRAKRSAWSVVVTAQVTALREDVLTLTFPSQQDVVSFKEMSDPEDSVSELLRSAIMDVIGLRVKFVARGPGGAGQPRQQQQQQQSAPAPAPQTTPSTPAPAPQTTPTPAAPPAGTSAAPQATAPAAPAPAAAAPAASSAPGRTAPTPDPEAPAPTPASAPASAPAPQPSGAPVTDWAVATIPAADPTVDAVPESVEPSWAAPFGTVPASAPVAPAEVVEPQGQPTAAAAPQPGGGQPTGTAPAAAPGVPVDDYPLDDEPYDDGAPFPDPAAGSSPPPRQAPGRASPAQAAPAQAAPAQPAAAATPRTAPPARRAPVAGRYGEAVVREILNAQFIEETALHQDGV